MPQHIQLESFSFDVITGHLDIDFPARANTLVRYLYRHPQLVIHCNDQNLVTKLSIEKLQDFNIDDLCKYKLEPEAEEYLFDVMSILAAIYDIKPHGSYPYIK